jgi:ABC-type glutathione transport system ATPase component
MSSEPDSGEENAPTPDPTAGTTHTTEGESLLSVRDLDAGYGDLQILDGVDLDVADGEYVTVVGPNGAGKSTVMKSVFGLATYMGGRITLDGGVVTESRDHVDRAGDRLRRATGHVFHLEEDRLELLPRHFLLVASDGAVHTPTHEVQHRNSSRKRLDSDTPGQAPSVLDDEFVHQNNRNQGEGDFHFRGHACDR